MTENNNPIVDYTNPIWSQEAWSAYHADGVRTRYSQVRDCLGPSSLRILGREHDALRRRVQRPPVRRLERKCLHRRRWRPVHVGWKRLQHLHLSIDRGLDPEGSDGIGNFNVNKDVIDLSAIDASLTQPNVSFTFIGTSAFTSAGAQVRYQQDASNDITYVEATLAGESSPDLEIRLNGLLNLTAADFALTPAQSTADLAAGAGGALPHASAAEVAAAQLALAIGHSSSSSSTSGETSNASVMQATLAAATTLGHGPN